MVCAEYSATINQFPFPLFLWVLMSQTSVPGSFQRREWCRLRAEIIIKATILRGSLYPSPPCLFQGASTGNRLGCIRQKHTGSSPRSVIKQAAAQTRFPPKKHMAEGQHFNTNTHFLTIRVGCRYLQMTLVQNLRW